MKKLSVGVVGAGRIGKVHAEALVLNIPEVEVVAITDPRREEAGQVAARFGIRSVPAGFEELIGDRSIDAVVICSPTDTHAEYIIEAARAKKEIFCEKPIALTLEEIESALEEVRRQGVNLMIGFNRRFDPGFREIRRQIQEGRVGEPHLLRITSRDPSPPPDDYIPVSGGIFLDMAIHDFDMSRYLIGSEVTEVFARGAVRVDPKIGELGDYDTAVTSLAFDNGALGAIDNSRKACYGYDQRAEVFGSRGMVRIDNRRHNTHETFDENGSHLASPMDFFMDRYAESYANELEAFVGALTEGKRMPVTGEDGLMSVAIGLAARRSATEGRSVRVDEILRK